MNDFVPGPTCVPPKWDERMPIIVHNRPVYLAAAGWLTGFSQLSLPLPFGARASSNVSFCNKVAAACFAPDLLWVKPLTEMADL